ncbi:lysophospholipase D GDPD3 [Tachyglossus aculeatus]|uniref:lysophospholipase D GDPD3 n=1 Tax=Tachyglossus aculeatus TaxID=9261 RepID=UPI0018F454D3|nr:lysophospholipase D GDPD3 [Tachyglossus aculeatus]
MSSVFYYALPALGGYTLLSYCFLRRPWLLHSPRAPAFSCCLAAHRGGSGERIENTLEAFENAVTQRADLLELDCQLSQDGVVIVSHDSNLQRQSGLNKEIRNLNSAELPLYKEELEVYFSPGRVSRGTDRRMVRLEEVFQRFPRMPVSVEVKVADDDLIQKVAALTRQYGRSHITVWAAEKSCIMKKCRKANPEMPFSFTLSRGLWLLFLFYVGLLPFCPIPEQFLLCFLPSIINKTYFPFCSRTANWCAAAFLQRLIMRKSLIRHLEARGVQVVFWCLNEEADFKVALGLGASGVMTDYPTDLRRYLDSHFPSP